MKGYYESLLARDPREKVAVLGGLLSAGRAALPGLMTAGRSAMNFAGGAGRGLAGMELASGAGRAAQAGRTTAQIAQGASTAKGIYDTVKSPEPPAAPPGVKPGMKVGSLEARILRLVRMKLASGADWHLPVNALSYGAFALPYLSDTIHKNEGLTRALNAAGLLGLGATSADSLRQGDATAGYDLAGLGLMGAGLVHNMIRPTTHDTSTAPSGH